MVAPLYQSLQCLDYQFICNMIGFTNMALSLMAWQLDDVESHAAFETAPVNMRMCPMTMARFSESMTTSFNEFMEGCSEALKASLKNPEFPLVAILVEEKSVDSSTMRRGRMIGVYSSVSLTFHRMVGPTVEGSVCKLGLKINLNFLGPASIRPMVEGASRLSSTEKADLGEKLYAMAMKLMRSWVDLALASARQIEGVTPVNTWLVVSV
jgi:hypothetical protein